MKSSIKWNISFLIALIIGMLDIASPRLASAQGVTAGIDISNIVTITYSTDGAEQTPIESSPSGNSTPGLGNGQSTSFKVDRKIDLLVTNNGNNDVLPGDLQAELSFSLMNEGNDTQVFLLNVNNIQSTDVFDASNCSANVTSVSGTPLPGVLLPTVNDIKLKADQQANIIVKCDIPALNNGQAILEGHSSLISLSAITNKNSDGSNTVKTVANDTSSLVDTVFADSSGTDDSFNDGTHSSRSSYIALDVTTTIPPSLSINKTLVSVLDQQGGTTAVAGSEVTYKILITSNGSGIINNVLITDTTAPELDYKTESIRLDSNSLTDSSDFDQADFGITTANTATVNLGNITAGDQHEIQLTYVIK